MVLADSSILGVNTAFVGRVQSALLLACTNVMSEGATASLHIPRVALVHQILANPSNLTNYTNMFALSAAVDATVWSDATVAGATPLTTGNATTQQALVTDGHINNAVSAAFNAYAPGIPA